MLFIHRSRFEVPAADLFAWHERPEALADLLPRSAFIRVESSDGSLRDGSRVVLRFGIGPIGFRWVARHHGFEPGVRFRDDQISGPFRFWRHTHTVIPEGTEASVLEDHVEFELPGGWLGRLVAPVVAHGLKGAFEQRHALTRASLRRLRGGRAA